MNKKIFSCISILFFYSSIALGGEIQEFVQAAYDGNLAKVQEFLKKSPNKINDFTIQNESWGWVVENQKGEKDKVNALLVAAQNNQEAIVNELLKYKNLNLNAKTSISGKTALHYTGNQNVINALINKGADPNIQDDLGTTPLMKAVESGDTNAVKSLLKSPKINVNTAMPNTHETALSIAIESVSPDMDIVKALVAKGANINAPTEKGKTALEYAKEHKLTEIVKLFEQQKSTQSTKH